MMISVDIFQTGLFNFSLSTSNQTIYLKYIRCHQALQNMNFNRYRKAYCNLIVGIDDGIGKVVQTLEKNGMLENTVIFFSSDNGGVPFAGAFNYPFRYEISQPYLGEILISKAHLC